MKPADILRWYERGMITESMVVIDIVSLAATQDPASFADDVPKEWLDIVIGKVRQGPGGRVFGMGTDSVKATASFEDGRQAWEKYLDKSGR